MSEIKSTIERIACAAAHAIWKSAQQAYEKHWESPRAMVRRQRRLIDMQGKTLDRVMAERDALRVENERLLAAKEPTP